MLEAWKEGTSMSTNFSWHQSYQEAMLELNLAELPGKIRRAVQELQQRSGELLYARDPESGKEWQAICDALTNLSVIQRYELSPGFDLGSNQNASPRGAA